MRTELFSAITPYISGMLNVDDRHTLYWEESGNPGGVPVLLLHGGPGAGASSVHRRFFDPDFYRIVIFDQRGAGRSVPLGELRDNTTAHLIADIEKLRIFLRIERWMVFGGSWGATLAIAYGEAFPERCLGFVLRGIFLSRPSEIDWFFYGMRTVFPEAWRAFSQFLPESERSDLLSGYYRRLTHADPKIHLPAAYTWCQYEGGCSTLLPKNEAHSSFPNEDQISLALARIEAHYFVHRIFLPNNDLLSKINRLRRHPCQIIQGRYDMICPIVTADDLARAWPEAHYVIVPDAGHSALEPGVTAALIEATERFRSTCRHPKSEP